MSKQQYYEESKSHYGYPKPGKQNVTAEDIMNSHYFMTDKEWEENRKHERFDYVIIGSSFCSLAFTKKALENNPDAKILIIERGAYLHPDHYQNLPPAMETTVCDPSETFHWSLSQETHDGEYIKGLHGAYSFFGGRSSFWSGWCPEPTEAEMEGWPKELVKVVKDYFPKAKELLNVVPADEIFSGSAHDHPMFGKLQKEVQAQIKQASRTIKAVNNVIPAPLAVKTDMQRYQYYSKYSVVGLFLDLLKKTPAATQESQTERKNMIPSLQAITNCLVKKIKHDDKGRATELETSKGSVILGNAKLILAMGILPTTTLVLNSFPVSSFPRLSNVGKRFTAHFISSITARVPLSMILPGSTSNHGDLELGAVYVAGEEKESKQQFHLQITAVNDRAPETNVHDRIRHLPDVLAAPSIEQLQTSKDHVVFVCACLGELDHKNEQNWFQLENSSNGEDVTCNCQLQVVANATDNTLWDTMDESAFKLFEGIVTRQDQLEYWHSDITSNPWKATRPSPKQYRHDGLVHEASTMWIGDDDDTAAPVGLDYRLRGIDNVYITGASLWPRGGSWNPVGTIVSMAMHLADQICKRQDLPN